jgi:hypothetical protein
MLLQYPLNLTLHELEPFQKCMPSLNDFYLITRTLPSSAGRAKYINEFVPPLSYENSKGNK